MTAEFLLSREKRDALTAARVKNLTYRLHFHSHIELCLVLDGEIEVTVNEQQRLLKKGEMSVAWSYDAQSYYTPTYSDSISIVIPPNMFEEFSPLLENRHTRKPFITDPALFDKIYHWVEELMGCEDELSRKGFIYIILGKLFKSMSFEENTEKPDRSLSLKVLFYLNEHYKEKLNISDVAHALGYSPNYMALMFKNTIRLSFNQYLTLLRLRKSVMLMREGRSITESALESGFQSVRSFYRAFQSEFGCTPRSFISDLFAR